jgi:homeobox-leucine zipper protein
MKHTWPSRFSSLAQNTASLWAVVDTLTDTIIRSHGGGNNNLQHHMHNSGVAEHVGCRLLPTGCTVQDTNNDYLKAMSVYHVEYEETA